MNWAILYLMKKFPENIIWWATHPEALVRRIAGKVYRRFNHNEPWISLGAVKFCDVHLNKEMSGLEWGSGRSTIWFAKRLKKITSVEDNQSWHGYVKKKLQEDGHTNVDYRFVALDHAFDQPVQAHYDVLPKYVAIANEFPDTSLDFVVVDGHYRQACVTAALPKLKKGGYLLIDNSNWMKRELWGVPSHWEVVHCSFGFDGETTIWKKP